jgi:hypothetical protein
MFKIGSKYTRKDIGWIMLPETGRPKGGNWDTGYVRKGNDLIIFMNIGRPGATGHDFPNEYDPKTKMVTWFGKPRSHSKQNTFKNLLSGKWTPHFFARWDKKPLFQYLGIGKIIHFEDNYEWEDGQGNPFICIKTDVQIDDIEHILNEEISDEIGTENENYSPFSLEKQLEDFIVNNWEISGFGKKYDIYEKDGEKIGRQYQTITGPCDILAISKDKKEFLIIELKKGRASDRVAGQLGRYMTDIKMNLAKKDQIVKGCVVANEDDRNLKYALSAIPNTDFYKYEIQFNLKKVKSLK